MDLRPAYPPIRTTTTSATAVEVLNIPVRRSSLVEVRVNVRAQRRTTFGVAAFSRVLRAENNAGALELRTDAAPVPDYNPNGYAVSVSASGENLTVSVAGVGGHTVDWDVEVSIPHA